jgi:hypothetical protein
LTPKDKPSEAGFGFENGTRVPVTDFDYRSFDVPARPEVRGLDGERFFRVLNWVASAPNTSAFKLRRSAVLYLRWPEVSQESFARRHHLHPVSFRRTLGAMRRVFKVKSDQ